MAITVHITDEGTRRALQSALWHYADSAIGSPELHDVLWGAAVARARAEGDEVARCQRAIAGAAQTLAGTLRTVDVVTTAEIGSRVVLDVDESEFRGALDYCKASIEEHEGFWAATLDAREEMIATRDGAVRLLSILAPAEAVA